MANTDGLATDVAVMVTRPEVAFAINVPSGSIIPIEIGSAFQFTFLLEASKGNTLATKNWLLLPGIVAEEGEMVILVGNVGGIIVATAIPETVGLETEVAVTVTTPVAVVLAIKVPS